MPLYRAPADPVLPYWCNARLSATQYVAPGAFLEPTFGVIDQAGNVFSGNAIVCGSGPRIVQFSVALYSCVPGDQYNIAIRKDGADWKKTWATHPPGQPALNLSVSGLDTGTGATYTARISNFSTSTCDVFAYTAETFFSALCS